VIFCLQVATKNGKSARDALCPLPETVSGHFYTAAHWLNLTQLAESFHAVGLRSRAVSRLSEDFPIRHIIAHVASSVAPHRLET
jgi:hypothetical protein